MDWSLPNNLVDWSQVVSAALSMIALGIALFAVWKAKRDLTAERRRVHELEVLRDLSAIVEQFGLGLVPRLRSSLLLLPGSDDLPLLRAAVDARPSTQAVASFNEKYPGATALVEPTNINRHAQRERYARFRIVRDDGTVVIEMGEAIDRRFRR
jgi:hypothetical protein